MKAQKTWVVVANGRMARILGNDGPGKGLKDVPGGTFEEPRLSGRDFDADRPGRTFDSIGRGRHAMERPTSHQELGRRRIADAVADWLRKPGLSGSFDRLVLVAAPKTLADLRAALARPIAAKIVGEFHKDLTKAKADKIAAMLKREFRF